MGRIPSPTRPAGRSAASYGPRNTDPRHDRFVFFQEGEEEEEGLFRADEEGEEEEEGLFKANAVNEEDPECDRATQV